MKIVYKKFDGEHKRLASHLVIDPLADGGGQQVLSPYHAMGCNPAMMIDPLGLQGQTSMSTPGNDHFIMPVGYMVEGTYVYLSADRLGTGKSIGMKRLEAYIYNSMMEMAEAGQQKIIAVRFAAALDMINGYNAALQSLVSSYDIPGMMNSQIKPAYLDGGKEGDGGDDLVLQGQYQLNPIPKGQKQKGTNDCVYTVLSMISEVYGDNLSAKYIKQLAIKNGLGTKKNGVLLTNIEPLAALLGYQTEHISYQTTQNGSQIEVLSSGGAMKMYNSLKQNKAVILVESIGNNMSHSNLIYATERWSNPTTGGNPEFKYFSISTETGTAPSTPYIIINNKYNYFHAFVFSIYK